MSCGQFRPHAELRVSFVVSTGQLESQEQTRPCRESSSQTEDVLTDFVLGAQVPGWS